MKILITGAFGNLGENIIRAAVDLQENHELVCYDLENSKTRDIKNKLLESEENRNFKTIWGDILDTSKVREALRGVDTVIHLAAILHPKTERNPELAYRINVEGTRNLINCINAEWEGKSLNRKPKIIFASSVSIYGPWPPNGELMTNQTPINPSDVYTRTKAQAEDLIKESGLPWIIFRITGAPGLSLMSMDYLGLLFEIPLDQQIEFVHPKDVGIAFIHAAIKDIQNKTLLIGGGEQCQITNRELMKGFFQALGLKMIGEDSFKKPMNDADWFYVGWMDTEQSQNLLQYQKHTLEDFLEDLKDLLGWKRKIFRLSSPLIKKYLELKSPYRNKK